MLRSHDHPKNGPLRLPFFLGLNLHKTRCLADIANVLPPIEGLQFSAKLSYRRSHGQRAPHHVPDAKRSRDLQTANPTQFAVDASSALTANGSTTKHTWFDTGA